MSGAKPKQALCALPQYDRKYCHNNTLLRAKGDVIYNAAFGQVSVLLQLNHQANSKIEIVKVFLKILIFIGRQSLFKKMSARVHSLVG